MILLNDSLLKAAVCLQWVQCDTCKGWHHQICGLFYDKSDSEGEYKCPICCLKEKEIGDFKPSTNNVVFSAKDLPQTRLSNHIEERLFRLLKQDRIERAKVAGKRCDEVVRETIMIHSTLILSFYHMLYVNYDLPPCCSST